MKIITRNINGIRATIKKWFLETISKQKPDILCLQEIKAFENQIPPELHLVLKEYTFIRNPAKKPGYAGTATFYKKNIEGVSNTIFSDNELFSKDGRIIETRFRENDKEFALFNVYFPNGNPKTDGKEMLSSKLDFYDKFVKYSNILKWKWLHVICGGDFNVAHKIIDLASPQQNKKSIGFLESERKKIDKIIESWFTDVFRHYHPKEPGHYTRRSYRKWMKESNKGWRYDYFFVSSNVLPIIKKMEHLSDIRASDHCPLLLVLQ